MHPAPAEGHANAHNSAATATATTSAAATAAAATAAAATAAAAATDACRSLGAAQRVRAYRPALRSG